MRSKEGRHRAIVVEDFKNVYKHHPLNLGSRDGGGQLNGTLHEIGMRRGKEFDPVDRRAVGPLGRSDERDKPVPQEEPVMPEQVEYVKHRGVCR